MSLFLYPCKILVRCLGTLVYSRLSNKAAVTLFEDLFLEIEITGYEMLGNGQRTH